jgi:hypothetical protein
MKNRPSHRKGGSDRAQNVARRCTTPCYPLARFALVPPSCTSAALQSVSSI